MHGKDCHTDLRWAQTPIAQFVPSLLKNMQSIYLHASLQKKKCARALVLIRNIHIIYIYIYKYIFYLHIAKKNEPGAGRMRLPLLFFTFIQFAHAPAYFENKQTDLIICSYGHTF